MRGPSGFVHGLHNKPEADYPFKLWKRKLDTNLVRYESAAGTIEGMDVPPELNRLDHKEDERIHGLARKLDVDPDLVGLFGRRKLK